MKKISLLLVAVLTILTLQNCKKSTNLNKQQQVIITDDDAKSVIESDTATDNLLEILDLYGFNSSANRSHQLPSCVTQTITRNGTSVIIVWEFDTNGCTLPNGNTYRGTVTITRDWNINAHNINGSISFDNFYVNDIHIEGSTDFIRELNSNGNPQVTHNYDLTFTFPNGDTAARSGVRTREWSEGFGTPSRNDDVFLVTGNTHIERRNGVVLDAVITNPLRREVPCRYIVSGTIEITKNNQTAILDFGIGNCDDEATLTLPDGTVRIIHL